MTVKISNEELINVMQRFEEEELRQPITQFKAGEFYYNRESNQTFLAYLKGYWYGREARCE